nr:MAG TPA: hypothetical protein [Bacteriophage sp.]
MCSCSLCFCCYYMQRTHFCQWIFCDFVYIL